MFRRTRIVVAGLAAFLLGFPLAERSFGAVGGWIGAIIDASIYGSDGGS